MTLRSDAIKRCLLPGLLLSTALAGCDTGSGTAEDGSPATQQASQPLSFQLVGKLESPRLNEASGLQAGAGGVFFLHNDDGARIFFSDATGQDLGSRKVAKAKSRDWEDMTRVPGPDGPLLVIGDVGDNKRSRRKVSLYFLAEPIPGAATNKLQVHHRLRLSYPDGPRDVESMAYDPVSDQILFLSKRDKPPRLYGVPLDLALWQQELEAEFLSEVPEFRPPTRQDILRNPRRGLWVSQPTGMDISPDGRMAAVLTYRSLYLFQREAAESWPEAFQRQPTEVPGPPGTHDEAVGFSLDGRSVYVTTERRPAPLYRLDLPTNLP